ncbi:MAG: PAS domain-containing protein [Chloroflexi bacterium]|nr:PAS domain-containing protein [Chloroflexota bacterium]
MFPSSLLYALPLLAIAALTGGLAIYVFSRRSSLAGATTFGLLLAALSEWAVAYAFEFLLPALEGKILTAKLEYLGILSVGPLWLAFALRYTQRARWLTWRTQFLLAVPGLITFPLVLTNESHHLIWTDVALDPSGFPGLLIGGHGMWFWVSTAIAYLFVLGGVVLYLLTYARAPRVYRRQIGIMVAGSLVPLAGNAIYLAGLSPLRGLDLTPFGFAFSGILLALGFFRFGLLNLAPIAAQVVVDNLRDPVIVLDARKRVVNLNPTARHLFGLGDEAIGRSGVDVLGASDSMRQHLELMAPQTEVEIAEGDNQRWFEVETSPLLDGRDRALGSVILLHDITRERALRSLRDDLTSMLVHDLLNPLGTIHTALKVIEVADKEADKRPPDAEPGRHMAARKEAMEIARRSIARAQTLLDSLLDVNRLERGQMPVKPEAIAPAEAARAVVSEMTPSARGRGLTLELDAPASIPAVNADPQLLDRVLRNLIGNAVKFTPAGGRVRLSAQPNGTEIVFSITDTGRGIPSSVVARLFEKFVRGPGPERGSGLGLAFCKLAVEAMGGRIWADNLPERGAAFHFTLPQLPNL